MAVTIRENDVKASNLFFVSLGIGTLVTLLSVAYSDRPTYLSLHPGIALFSLIGGTLFCVAMALGVRAGHHRVKIFFVIYCLLALVLNLFGLTTSAKPLSVKLLEFLSPILYSWAAVIVARDLLRPPAAGEAEVTARPAD